MNAITPFAGHAKPIERAFGRFGRLRECPIPGEDCIPVTIDGTRLLVFHAAGRPTWCHIQLPDGVIITGVRASDIIAGTMHGKAVELAGSLLAGLRQAGEYPTPPAAQPWLSDLRVAVLSVAFGGAAFLVMWGLVALVALQDWQR